MRYVEFPGARYNRMGCSFPGTLQKEHDATERPRHPGPTKLTARNAVGNCVTLSRTCQNNGSANTDETRPIFLLQLPRLRPGGSCGAPLAAFASPLQGGITRHAS
jgi:hypothetical protein